MSSARQIAIIGTTASGKTELAMAFASCHPDVEIVCVDAMQVYRRMDIGTAKPSLADQALVRHHCLDLVEPSEPFSVADFQNAAEKAMTAIGAGKNTAVFVAGTGLYMKALTDHLQPPGQWPLIRAGLEGEAGSPAGVAELFRRLETLDARAATKMDPRNARRIVRALEVCLGSGKPFSSFGPGVDAFPATAINQVGIRWSRPVLRRRIAERVSSMIDAGLLAEVTSLLNDPAGLSVTAQQALGYKELIAHINGELSLDAAVALIIQRTGQFAVRQERWFRRDPRVRWVDLSESSLEALPTLEQTTQQ